MKYLTFLIIIFCFSNKVNAQSFFYSYTFNKANNPDTIIVVLEKEGAFFETTLDSIISTSILNTTKIEKKVIHYSGIGAHTVASYETLNIPISINQPYTLKLYSYWHHPFINLLPFPYLCDSLIINIGSTGIFANNKQNPNFSIYPNPASDYLTIDLESLRDVTAIKLVNLLNQEVKDFPINSNKLDVQDVKNGFYIIRIFTKNAVYDKKIQILK